MFIMNQYHKDMLQIIEKLIVAKDASVETLVLYHDKPNGSPNVVVTFAESDYDYTEVYSVHTDVAALNQVLKSDNKKLKSEEKYLKSRISELEKTIKELDNKSGAKAKSIALEYLKTDLGYSED